MSDLSDYKVTFSRMLLFGKWTWQAETPDGRTLLPFGFGFIDRDIAEQNALSRIRLDAQTETLTGEELVNRRKSA